jgi:prepilin-type N-terminal cleavage/methylation domain-containing protein
MRSKLNSGQWSVKWQEHSVCRPPCCQSPGDSHRKTVVAIDSIVANGTRSVPAKNSMLLRFDAWDWFCSNAATLLPQRGRGSPSPGQRPGDSSRSRSALRPCLVAQRAFNKIAQGCRAAATKYQPEAQARLKRSPVIQRRATQGPNTPTGFYRGRPLSACRSRSAFTMVELLVTITIIGILAAMTLGALQLSREAAREAKTKATIAKINGIVMERYESYLTRRVPIQVPPGTTPANVAQMRLNGIRDLMRMEMPERWVDVTHLPVQFTQGAWTYSVPEPALHRIFYAKWGAHPPNSTDNYSHSKCLYMFLSVGSPEAMEQFSQSEIKVDTDGWPYFVDGWGKPIFFLRWAPGCTVYSSIQSGDVTNDHDPFDARRVDGGAFHLVPLIYSFGRTGVPNVTMARNGQGFYGNPYESGAAVQWTSMNPYSELLIGAPDASVSGAAMGNITNHQIDQR